MAAAKKHGKLLELNANPARLDLDDVVLRRRQAARHPDRHQHRRPQPDGLDVLRYGILQARRAGLTAADVANTRPWAKMKKMIGNQSVASGQ